MSNDHTLKKAPNLKVNETWDLAQKLINWKFSVLLFHSNRKGPKWKMAKLEQDKWTNVDDQQLQEYIKGKAGNIGIRTGKHSGNLLVLDADLPKNGEAKQINGVKMMTRLFKNHNLIKKDLTEYETVIDRSGSGGIRMYFIMPPNFKLSQDAVKYYKHELNIDLLGNGRAVIAPGSRYPGCFCPGKDEKDSKDKHKCSFENGICQFKGNVYEWIKSPKKVEIANLPDELISIFSEVTDEDAMGSSSFNEISFNTIFTKSDVKNVREMLKLINDSAWDCSYDEWIKIVWALIGFGFTSEEIHHQCSRGQKYEVESTEKVISTYNPRFHYNYTEDSVFFKWAENNIKTGVNKFILRSFLPSKVPIDKHSDWIIIHNMYKANYGIASMFHYFWAGYNVKTWGFQGKNNEMVTWHEPSLVWQKSDHTGIWQKLVRRLVPILDSFESTNLEFMETVKTISKGIHKNIGEAHIMDAVSNMCEDKTYVHKVNKIIHEIPTNDGKIVDLKTSKVRDRTRDDIWSTTVNAKLIPYSECGEVLKYLDEISMGDAQMVLWLICFMGLCLTRELGQRKAFIFHGSGKNGKSTFVESMHNMMGEFSRPCPNSVLLDHGISKPSAATPELIAQLNTRFTFVSDVKDNESLNVENIKKIVGGDTIAIRDLFDGQTDNKFATTLVLCCNNSRPKITGNDDAMCSRILLVPFDGKFEVTLKSVDYVKYIQSLTDQWFSVAVYGAKKWYKHMLPKCDRITNATLEYINENDAVQDFISDTIEQCTGQILYSKDIASKRYRTDSPTSFQIRTVNADFEQKKFVKSRDKYGTFFKDIKFKDSVL